MKKIKILVASHSLRTLGGSETFTYTILEELSKRVNVYAEYFTFHKGTVSDKIENELNVPFYSNDKYDLILANHFTSVDYLYKKGFVIQTCHGIYPKLEKPSENANAFVAISQEVQDHLANKGLSSKIILNGINTNRFQPDRPISSKLSNVLSLCHSEDANRMVKLACEQMRLNYLEAYKYDNPIWEVEKLCNKADLVVGLGRSAYEAMSCGRPVVSFDKRRYFPSYGDGYLSENLGLSLLNNCSGRYFKNTYSVDDIIRELNKYSKADGIKMRNFALKELNVSRNIDKYLEYWMRLENLKKNNVKKNLLKKVKFLIGERGVRFGKKIYKKFNND